MPGYQQIFVEKLPPAAYCPLCRLPIRDAVRPLKGCDHKFCESCIRESLMYDNQLLFAVSPSQTSHPFYSHIDLLTSYSFSQLFS